MFNICKKCLYNNELNAKFCSNCGVNLKDGISRLCLRCGNYLEHGEAFCPRCGMDLRNLNQKKYTSHEKMENINNSVYFKQKKMNKKYAVIFLASFSVFSFFLTIILFFYVGLWALLLPVLVLALVLCFYVKNSVEDAISYHTSNLFNDIINKK